jgi:hypothetical protein
MYIVGITTFIIRSLNYYDAHCVRYLGSLLKFCLVRLLFWLVNLI